jgi:hypothetical protein
VADIRFQCSRCGGNLEVDDEGAGQEIACPICDCLVTIPKLEYHSALTASPKYSKRKIQRSAFVVALVFVTGVALLLAVHRWIRKPQQSGGFQLKLSVERDDANDQFKKGLEYYYSWGVPKDEAEAA